MADLQALDNAMKAGDFAEVVAQCDTGGEARLFFCVFARGT